MSYEEKRVTVATYGVLPGNSPLLVEIPTAPNRKPQKLHKLAAQGLHVMAAAAVSDLGIVLLAASGWRPHLWASWAAYEQAMIKQYGSVAKGRKFRAFNSPHETGLAIDFGCGGLEPRSATIPQQRQSQLWHWLVEHAWYFGFHPYKAEPWHWEFPVGLQAFKTGVAEGDGASEPAPICEEGDPSCIESPFDDGD
jgi:LAS superfamily LD-carboxypeptidase LdcB